MPHLKQKTTGEYQLALKEATHEGRNSEILYREDPDQDCCDFFGCSTLVWQRAGFLSALLRDERYYRKL